MTWKTRYLPDERLIEIVFTGKFQMTDLVEVTQGVVKLVEQKKTFWVVCDCTAIIHNTTAFNIYEMPRIFDAQNIDHRIKEAVLLPEEAAARKNLAFYETVCRNRGYNVKVFDTRAEAIDWLKA